MLRRTQGRALPPQVMLAAIQSGIPCLRILALGGHRRSLSRSSTRSSKCVASELARRPRFSQCTLTNLFLLSQNFYLKAAALILESRMDLHYTSSSKMSKWVCRCPILPCPNKFAGAALTLFIVPNRD